MEEEKKKSYNTYNNTFSSKEKNKSNDHNKIKLRPANINSHEVTITAAINGGEGGPALHIDLIKGTVPPITLPTPPKTRTGILNYPYMHTGKAVWSETFR